MNIPAELKFTKDHEWIKLEGNVGTIGITDFAQGELGDVVFVDVDPKLSQITSGESFGTIEAVKTVSELYAPCNGKVVEVNSKLESEPQLVNSDPYGDGWIIKIELTDMNQLNELLSPEAYREQIS